MVQTTIQLKSHSFCYNISFMVPTEAKKEIESISKQIVEKYCPEKVILFGSAVWGGFNKDSDLDFFIIKKDTPDLGRDRARQLRKMINKNWAADFFIYRPQEIDECAKLGDPFVSEILSRGKVLYVSK